MKKVLLAAALALAAGCSRVPPPSGAASTKTPSKPTVSLKAGAAEPASGAEEFLPLQVKEAAGISVGLRPARPRPGQPLEVEVSLDTHSGNLDLDLVAIATMRAGTLVERPERWEGPMGGHHVKGKLVFPGADLSAAKRFEISLELRGEVLVFAWEL